MKKILITGIAGLLGSHLSRYLLNKGYDVYGIDNLSGGYYEFIDTRITDQSKFFPVDVLNTHELNSIFDDHKFNVVFHLSAYASEGLSPFVRNYTYSNNLLSTINIVNCCVNHKVDKLIFTSSMAVYGDGNPPFSENDPLKPVDPYGIAKVASEQDIIQAGMQFGLKYNIVRPHNVLGVYQNIWDKYRNVIGIWIRQIIDHKPITIFGDGSQVRAFSDIKFYLEPFEKLIHDFDNEVFNLGSDKYVTIKEAAGILLKVAAKFGYDEDIIYLEKRNEVKTAYSRHDKALEQLGFNDNTDLEEIFYHMFEWALKEPQRSVKNLSYEIEKDIYSFWK